MNAQESIWVFTHCGIPVSYVPAGSAAFEAAKEKILKIELSLTTVWLNDKIEKLVWKESNGTSWVLGTTKWRCDKISTTVLK